MDDGDIQIHSFDQLDELKKLKTLKDIDFDFDFDEGDEPSIFRWNTDEDLPEELKGKIKIQREGDTKIFLFDDNEGDASTFIRRGGKEKAFLGIYMGDYTNEDGERITANGQGVVISKIVKGSAAEAAGLKAGDIITRLNGEAVDSHGDISRAIKAQGVGGNLDIAYLRNWQAGSTNATLKGKKVETNHFYFDNNHSWDSFKEERPCNFIGVQINTSRSNGKTIGLKISSVIDDTPAANSSMQRGDVITAVNGVNVKSFKELLAERNKYDGGDKITISYLRDGQPATDEITFVRCGEEEIEIQEEEKVYESPSSGDLRFFASNLLLENFRAFPNPTSDGMVNVRFEAEAKPALIKIIDIDGRELYREDIPNFDGTYNNRLNLGDAPSGTLLLSVRQGDKLFTQKIINNASDSIRP